METFKITDHGEGVRVRWVYDEAHETRGRFWLGSDEETREAEEEEAAKLESGAWVALGAIVEMWCKCCEHWRETDSLWGIVIEPNERELREYAEDSLDLGRS